MRPYCIECLSLRFWSKVDQSGGPDACWPWTGSMNGHGRGSFYFHGRLRHATQVAWFLTHGALPPPKTGVLHRCDRPRCVNPAHLFLGSQLDNIRDMDAKGRRVTRATCGEANNRARLTAGAVATIRADYAQGVPVKALAETHGVTLQAIYYVVRRVTWKHIP